MARNNQAAGSKALKRKESEATQHEEGEAAISAANSTDPEVKVSKRKGSNASAPDPSRKRTRRARASDTNGAATEEPKGTTETGAQKESTARRSRSRSGTRKAKGKAAASTTKPRSPSSKRKQARAKVTLDPEDVHSVRASKLDSDQDYEPEQNPWSKVLIKVNREITKLKKEQHIMQTFAAHDSKAGPKMVKQTAESKRCAAAMKRSKEICTAGLRLRVLTDCTPASQAFVFACNIEQHGGGVAIRDFLKDCETADADAAIDAQHFDEDGEIDNVNIRCAACNDPDSSDANDILLCDGDLCHKAYHVGCLPVKATFDPEQLPDDVGWLCPACDCRYDILWNLAENFELDYDELIPMPWHEMLTDEDLLPEGGAGGGNSILDMDFGGSDDDDEEDEDFADSDDDENAGRAAGGAEDEERAVGAPASAQGDDADGSDDDDTASKASSSDFDEHAYVSDSDIEDGGGGGMQQMLQLLEQDKDVPPEQLIVSGKRQRSAVDYRRLNDEMFGAGESYEGERDGDDDFKFRSSGGRRRQRSS